jgi:hypothetical protein
LAEKACEGGRVLEAFHDMAECAHCGTCVRWDLQDHPFFGFQHCEEKLDERRCDQIHRTLQARSGGNDN